MKEAPSMTIRLRFPLSTVVCLAEHAAVAAGHVHPVGSGHTGAALLLSSGTDGIWLSSNGLPVLPAPAGQPGSLDRLAAFADRCPPATTWLEQVQLLPTETPLAAVLPLVEPTRRPLLEQLRAGAAAGATTLIVLLSGTGVDVAVGRHRHRGHQPAC
jgi:hypothetical protein